MSVTLQALWMMAVDVGWSWVVIAALAPFAWKLGDAAGAAKNRQLNPHWTEDERSDRNDPPRR